MEKDSLTYHAFKNSSWSMFGYFWPIVFTLLITPIVVLTLGAKEYGVYLFINASMGLFGLFELGYSVAVLKYLSYYFGQKDQESIKRLTHSANLIFLIMGSFGLLISIAIGLGGASYLPASFSAYAKYSKLFILAGGINFFTTIIITYMLILQAVQRFDISTKIGIASITLSNLGMLFVVKMGGSIQDIFILQLCVSLIFCAVIYHQAKKVLPIATFRFFWHKKEIFECYRFGIFAYINNIANVALASLDRIVIPFFVGPSNLTYYNMPGNVAMKIPGLTNTLTVNMLPTASQLSGSNETVRIQTLYIRSFRLITIIAGALTVTTISFSHELLRYWLNSDFAAKSGTVLIILALTNFILALFGPLSGFLLGIGKLKSLSIASCFMGLFNAVALFLLLPRYGIEGAAWAYLLSVLPVFYLFYYVETNFLSLTDRSHQYRKMITGNLIVGLLVFLINVLVMSLFVTNLMTVLIAGGVSVLIYVILYKSFGFFEQEDWKDIEHFSVHFFKKIAFWRGKTPVVS